MQVDDLDDFKIYKRALKIIAIGNKAIHKSQERNRENGLPNVYSKRGRIYYELPNGDITYDNPLESSAEE